MDSFLVASLRQSFHPTVLPAPVSGAPYAKFPTNMDAAKVTQEIIKSTFEHVDTSEPPSTSFMKVTLRTIDPVAHKLSCLFHSPAILTASNS